MTLTVIALTRNERYLAPYFLRHYEPLADQIVVFDNQSTDGTPEFLSRSKKVDVFSYDTGGVLRDDIHAKMKSERYRSLPGDWFIIVDFDEFVWRPNLREYLTECEKNDINLPLTTGYQMIGDAAPEDDGRLLLTDAIRNGAEDWRYSKPCIVHRSFQIDYVPGAHRYACRWMADRPKRSEVAEIKLLHYSWLSLEYGLEKRRRAAAQLSPENIKNGWGAGIGDLAAQQKVYEELKALAKPVI